MKKVILLGVLCFLLLCPTLIFADDCATVVRALEDEGYLFVKISKNEAFAAIEPLIWDNSPYRRKLGMANCIKSAYGVGKVYLVKMGKTDDLIAVYDGVKFKVY